MGIFIAAAASCGAGSDSATPDARTPDARTPDAPTSATEITIRTFTPGRLGYAGHTTNATLVAFQDGPSGVWNSLTGDGGVYHATVTGQLYGVAVSCATQVRSRVQLYYQAVSDTLEVHADGCPSRPELVRFSVDVQGLPSVFNTQVWVGSSLSVAVDGPVKFDVPKGPVGVFAFRYAQPADHLPAMAYRAPSIDVQAEQTLTLDMSKALPLEMHAVTLTGTAPSDAVSVDSSYATPHSFTYWPLENTSLGSSSNGNYVTVDRSLRQADDLTRLVVTARHRANNASTARTVLLVTKNPGDQAVTLPPELPVVAAPVLDRTAEPIRATVTIPTAAPTRQSTEYVARLYTGISGDINSRTWTLVVQPGWADAQASVTLTTPDLSHLAGWSTDMALVSDAPVNWELERIDRNTPSDAVFVDGQRILISRVEDTIDP